MLKIEVVDKEVGEYVYGTFNFDEIDYFIECLSVDEYLSNDEKECGRLFCLLSNMKVFLDFENGSELLYELTNSDYIKHF